MYERYMICQTLKNNEKCFRVQKYDDGEVIDVFHEHIPSYRISSESESEVLKALIARVAQWSEIEILHSFLNNRNGSPKKSIGPIAHTTYPEEGVIRRYLSSNGVTAWSDSVISPGAFRINDEHK